MPVAQPGELLIWTDGACKVNPGPGGWAAIVCDETGAVVSEHHGGAHATTNNIMEMTAALEGLRAVPASGRACVVTDSRYLHDGMTSWLTGWKKRGWKTAGGQAVKNREIWEALEAETGRHEAVRWHWVRGHVGTELNERADALAVLEAERHA
jgi:ribonuclease HI